MSVSDGKGLETEMFGVDHGAAPPSDEARAAWETFHREHEAWLQHRKGKEPRPPEIGLYVAPLPADTGRETGEMEIRADTVSTAIDRAYLPPKTFDVVRENPTLPVARVALRPEIDPRQQPTTRVHKAHQGPMSSEKDSALEQGEETSETAVEGRGRVGARWSEDATEARERLPERGPVRAVEPRSAWEKEAPLPGIRPSALPSAHAPAATESVMLPMNKGAPKWVWGFGLAFGLFGVLGSAWLAGWLQKGPSDVEIMPGAAASLVSTAVTAEAAPPVAATVDPPAPASAPTPEIASALPEPVPTPRETATARPSAAPMKAAVSPSPPAATPPTTATPAAPSPPTAAPAPTPKPATSGGGIFGGPRF